MNREDARTTTFDAVVAEYLDKQPDGSRSCSCCGGIWCSCTAR
jgi:hypothetical protein